MKKLLAVLMTVLVPLTLVACGGDDDKGPSKADYIEKADAICKRSDTETNAIFEAAFEDPQDPQPDEAQAALEEALPVVKKDLQELKDLEAPEDDKTETDAIWTAIDAGIKTLEEASADPDAALASLLSEPFAPGEKLAGEYGMKDCGPDEE
jgi:hypothetical protein